MKWLRRWAITVEVGRSKFSLGGPHLWEWKQSLMEPRRFGAGLFIDRWWGE